MELLKTLNNINTMIEATLVIELTDEDFADGREEIEHIYFHEACHAAISHCVPWIHTLDEEEHTAVDEIMARFLELEIGQSFGMPVHTSQEHVDELRLYPVHITLGGFDHLLGVWQEYFWPNKDLAGMATYVLTYIRHRRVIYHILPRGDWREAEEAGVYAPESLETEGFIHCSKVDQVLSTANRYFRDQEDLFLLCIASEKVRAEIRYEDLTGSGVLYPHIYGPLTLEAVVNVSRLDKDWRGKFVLPAGLSALDGSD
jgi:uncharacterized protein (DUF952 family)